VFLASGRADVMSHNSDVVEGSSISLAKQRRNRDELAACTSHSEGRILKMGISVEVRRLTVVPQYKFNTSCHICTVKYADK